MIKLLIQIINDSTNHIPLKSNTPFNNHWFWLAAAELGVIVYLLLKKQNKAPTSPAPELFGNAKEAKINMDDLMNNIHNARGLYKKLSTKCHPDRFIDSETNKRADLIFQEITKNQRNYSKLLELKDLAQKELNITI